MIRRRVNRRASTQCLLWLLLVAVAQLGFISARQQALGSMHFHRDVSGLSVSDSSTPLAWLASEWLSRWRQQKEAGHLLPSPKLTKVAVRFQPTQAESTQQVHGLTSRDGVGISKDHHGHDGPERHHHDVGDQSVIALDSPEQSAESGGNSVSMLLPILAAPREVLHLIANTRHNGRWHAHGAVLFDSLSFLPLLRPPTV